MQDSLRAVFISDAHLGSAACQAEHLLDFLNKIKTDRLYLVGDIIDLLEMRRKAHFPETHRAILSLIMRKAREGMEVIYIPGNHDDFFRQMAGQTFSGVKIRLNCVHRTADGRRFHVSHGDEFDQIVQLSPLALLVGDKAHGLMLKLNSWLNRTRRVFGFPYWSLAGYLKTHLGRAREFIQRYENAALKAARNLEVDGYICGHIHYAAFRRKDGRLYCNDGDWVEHCSALVETHQGQLRLLHWSEQPRWLAVEPDAEPTWIDEPIPGLFPVPVSSGLSGDKQAPKAA
ncbi:UDP-2,3-diacylglucosamine diphosphatase [Hahella sp. NBU794]|uniref:UDP-2,3-diacylglucosamine diphosphatase n=1 Tax=Hahella sp. NBU794 TaxID=3422590 RepID=UPI003D6F43C4